MASNAKRLILGTVTSAIFLVPVSARGDLINDIAIGLDYAGFNFLGSNNVNISGRENLLSGGVDFLTSVNFNGSVLDFGPWDVTLQGPVSISASTGGRLLQTLDVSFQTAGSARATASPLFYLLNVDSGNQLATVEGSVLLDGDLTINSLGFYDLALTYSTRQTVTTDGRFSDDQKEFDADFGPIHVRGNIFADAIALLTQPIFNATGQSNPFASFSSSAQLKELFVEAGSVSVSKLAATGNAASDDIAAILHLAGAGSPAAGADRIAGHSHLTSAGGAIIPEPPVLVLLLVGVPTVFWTRRRRRLIAH